MTPRTPGLDLDGDRPLRSTFRLLRPHRARVAVAMVFMAVKETPVWLMPVVTGRVIDVLVAGGPLSELWLWTAVAVVALAQNYPCMVQYTKRYMGAVRTVGVELRNALTERLQTLSIGFHTRVSASVVQTKVVRDVENVELMLAQIAHPLMSATMVLAGAIVMTALAVPQFLPVYALTIPLAVGLRFVLGRRSRRRNEDLRREVERFSARVGEMAVLMPITRAHGLERTAADRVASGARDVRDAGFQLDLLNGRFAAVSWVSMQMLGVLCLVLAAFASLSGLLEISAGEVVQLSSYFALLTGAMTSLLMLLPIGARGLESVRSIAEVLAEPDLEVNEGRRPVEAVHGRLTLEDVTYRYPEADVDALSAVSLDVAPGQVVAFVGPSGSGKSTVLNLVLGFVRPTGGRLLVDGVDAAGLDLRTVRRHVSVVPQEPVLFEGSVRDNVAYGLAGVSDERVQQALVDANAAEFVAALPQGWDTVVGQRGARLSGGQRQRLAIARALVRDPRVLLLDEATSALDAEAEAAVQEALARLMSGRTTLVVAHRLATVRAADRIVVMDGGRVVESGSREELLGASGRYAQLELAQHL